MAISWDSFDKIWASTSPLTPYSFSDPNYAQGWNFIGSTPPARQMWDSIQKTNDEKFKYLRDNFGTPNIVTQASQMTDTDKVYVYLGSEAGWNSGHWYYYDEGTSSWADGGVYNSVAFVTDTTLSIAGQPADAKATGDALALKSDLAGSTFTGNVGINADLSVTGDATIGTDLSVTGVSTLTGNVSAGADVTVVGDVSSANLNTSADATIGGDLSVTGTSTLAGNITTSGDISADNISATTNATVGGNLSVTGTSTLTGNINAGADITVVGDVSADNLTTTTNATVGGSLSVAGTSTLTGNVTASGDVNATGDVTADNISATTNGTIGGALSVAGASTLTGNVSAGADITVVGDVSSANITASNNATIGGNATVTGSVASASLTTTADGTIGGNLSVSGTTALAGTSTAPTPSADDNSTNIATTEYVQTEIKPIEVNADIVNKRVTNIEKLLEGNLYDYQTDSNSAYTKTVPAGAMPYASLNEVGGKTLVWNQLVNASVNPYDRTVSHSVADDVYTVASLYDASSQKYLRFVEASNLIQNHVYLGVADILVDNSDYFVYVQFVTGSGNSALSDETSLRATDTANYVRSYTLGRLTNETTGFAVRLANGMPQDVGGKVKNVQLYDLTLMFGAGNEPSTLSEFESMFPASYYSYNAGTLLSAGVTEVKSVGKNLADYSGGEGVPSNTSASASTKRIFPTKHYIRGITDNNYYYTAHVVSVSASADSLSFVAKNSIYGVGIPFNCKPSTSYTISIGSITNGKIGICWYKEDGTVISNFENQTNPVTKTSPADAKQGLVVLYANTINTTSTFDKIQIEESATATSYSPAGVIATYPIPASIQALEGYGWSAGTVSNYIDYERKKFVKCVDRIDLGTLTWTYQSTANAFYTTEINNIIVPATENLICPNYVFGSISSSVTLIASLPDKQVYRQPGNKNVFIKDSSYNGDANAFATAMSGVYLYYELATPQETDISAYLTDDNLISVEAGGTLTFENQNGNDYRIPIPSAETYMVDLQSAI